MPVMFTPRASWCAGDPDTKADSASSARRDEERSDAARRANTVPLEFCDTIDSRTTKRGDLVHLKVSEDTPIDGKLRFRRDAEAAGIIEDVEKPGRFGKKAVIKMRLDWVKDINGEHVPLQSYSTGHRFAAGAGGASLGAAVFLGPIGLLGGALVKGGHIVIKKGTRIQARLLRPESKKSSGKE
jgi:hypothetical protein